MAKTFQKAINLTAFGNSILHANLSDPRRFSLRSVRVHKAETTLSLSFFQEIEQPARKTDTTSTDHFERP